MCTAYPRYRECTAWSFSKSTKTIGGLFFNGTQNTSVEAYKRYSNLIDTMKTDLNTDSRDRLQIRARRLVSKFACDIGVQDSEWVFYGYELQQWLSELQSTVSYKTFACYRKWLANYAESLGHVEIGQLIRKQNRKRGSGKSVPSGKNLPDAALSTQEASEYYSEADLKKVAGLLSETTKTGNPRYQYGAATACYLRATLMTGLRPIEWYTAERHRDIWNSESNSKIPDVLEAVTAKTSRIEEESEKESHQRNTRKLVISDHMSDEKAFLDAWLMMVPKTFSEHRRFYENCRKTLERIGKRLWPDSKPLTLYTARHIFASELRRTSLYNRQEMAALLGHDSTTNQRYYGDNARKRNKGTRRFSHSLPKPWPGRAEEIKENDRFQNPDLFQVDLFQ